MSEPTWEMLHPKMRYDLLGYIPYWLNDENPESAAKQIDHNYRHGGGWHSFQGFEHKGDGILKYPGDPPMKPLAKARLREETIYFYDHSWVAIFKGDTLIDVARID